MADNELRNVVNFVIDDIGEAHTGVRPERPERVEPESVSEQFLNNQGLKSTTTTTSGIKVKGSVTTTTTTTGDPEAVIVEKTDTSRKSKPFRGNPGRR